jgi:hypothetical protein
MPASPSEPEKYSIDEMMDRLKSSPPPNPEDGELVIRPDGTQAIRVKRRKRRTSQPVKKEKQAMRRVRIFQVTAAMILVFLAALAIGGAVIYANSSPFRERLVSQIEKASGASVELQQFRMNPKTANAGSLTLTWPAGNVLERITMRGLNAEVFPASFLGNAMTGEEISVADGTLLLRFPQSGEPRRSFPYPGDTLPIRFNRYRIPSFNLTLGTPSAPVIRLTKSEASLNPETVNGRSQLSLYRGDIAIAGWPKLRLDRALVEFRGNETNIVGLRVFHETDNRGSFELSGPVYPYEADRLSSLELALDSFEISGITGTALGRLFAGRIDSVPVANSNFLAFQPNEGSTPALEIAFQLSPSSRIEIRGFPFLRSLALAIDDPWFLEPVFESDATGILHREKGAVAMRNLNFENKGRMACRGEITMAANQQLSGSLQIGIAEAMIGASKNPRLKTLFGPAQEGFRWLTLKIAGPASAPTDNFKDLFAATPTATTPEAVPGEDPGSTFEELTRPK